MIGFPKQQTDFNTNIYKNIGFKKEFDKQIQSYLNPSDFLFEKKEDWKYFPFHKLLNRKFSFDFSQTEIKDKSQKLEDSVLIQVKNGKAVACNSSAICVIDWQDFLQGKAKLSASIKNKVMEALNKKRNYFCSLNNTFHSQGFLLILKKELNQAVEIHYSQDSQNLEQALNLRNFIFVEKSAQVLEVFHSRDSNKDLFLNVQTDCFLEPEAKLEHTCLDQTRSQDSIIHHFFSHLLKGSQAYFFTLCLNAGLSRWLKHIEQQENSKSQIRALSLMNGRSHTDHKVIVNHKGLKGISEQLYKSFLFDSAKHIFQGLISIEKQAGESDSSQLNKNYLFGPKAFAVSFPELNIYPSNVKAGHGATVSPFAQNEELVFYLKSRGIDPVASVHLVLMSLLKEVLTGLNPRTYFVVENLIQNKLQILESSVENHYG